EQRARSVVDAKRGVERNIRVGRTGAKVEGVGHSRHELYGDPVAVTGFLDAAEILPAGSDRRSRMCIVGDVTYRSCHVCVCRGFFCLRFSGCALRDAECMDVSFRMRQRAALNVSILYLSPLSFRQHGSSSSSTSDSMPILPVLRSARALGTRVGGTDRP